MRSYNVSRTLVLTAVVVVVVAELRNVGVHLVSGTYVLVILISNRGVVLIMHISTGQGFNNVNIDSISPLFIGRGCV